MNCLNHDNREAELRCRSCGGHFCLECVKTLRPGQRTLYICLKCKGKCDSLKDLQEKEEEQEEIAYECDYWGQLKDVFKYPFRGKGPGLLLKGTVGFTIATFPVFLMLVVPNIITAVMVFIYIPFVLFFTVACFLSILEEVAVSDSDDPPELPDLFSVEDWVGKTFLFLLSAGLCMAPAMVYIIFTNNTGFLFWFFFSVGLYFIPMNMLAAALGESVSFLNPTKTIMSISNNFIAYSVIPALWLFLIFAWHLIGQGINIERFSIFGFIAKWYIFVYFLFVSMRPLGVFYRAYEDRLFGFDDEH